MVCFLLKQMFGARNHLHRKGAFTKIRRINMTIAIAIRKNNDAKNSDSRIPAGAFGRYGALVRGFMLSLISLNCVLTFSIFFFNNFSEK